MVKGDTQVKAQGKLSLAEQAQKLQGKKLRLLWRGKGSGYTFVCGEGNILGGPDRRVRIHLNKNEPRDVQGEELDALLNIRLVYRRNMEDALLLIEMERLGELRIEELKV
jgi:hypothetical protein